ncbi:MAG: sulfate reduction electron transfer complex DsrMKJOP subunit DsrM [Euryarchaeota archaeon]|nr:sulfate reduction electron transfer complex DsrMKJOP subunit DsrM [Euryarchaeota archaeon]
MSLTYFFFGVVVPYVAFVIFVIGFVQRIISWANIPVPLKIVVTGGYLEKPKTYLGVILRMASEIFVFRSLLRNTSYDFEKDETRGNKWLWLGSLAFHWMLLIIILRQLRYFFEPSLSWVVSLRTIDQIGAFIPGLYYSGLLIIAALLYLLIRRFVYPELRFISLFSDYFALLLLLAIVISGDLLAYYIRVNVVEVKAYMLSLLAFKPVVPELHWFFFLHLFFVWVLIAYFPFSKLVHAPGIFFSPTRNQKNDSRVRRYVNPWNYPVKVESWEQYAKRFEADLKAIEKKK